MPKIMIAAAGLAAAWIVSCGAGPRRHGQRQGLGGRAHRPDGHALRRRQELLQPHAPGHPAGDDGETRSAHRVQHARCVRLGSDAGLEARGRDGARSQPRPSADRSGQYRGRQARRCARGDASRRGARRLWLHGHRAGFRVPARQVHQPLYRQLEALPHASRLRANSGCRHSIQRFHGDGRRSARRTGNHQDAGTRGGACDGRRRGAYAAARGRSSRRRLRAGRQPQGCLPAHHSAARERRQHGHQADGRRHHDCCSPASSMAAGCSSAMCILLKATAKSRARRSRWAPP